MALIWHQSPLARLQRIYESCRPQLVAAGKAGPGVFIVTVSERP